MATTVNQATALLALARMMGKRILPNGNLEDWKDYIQFAFDYAWRYYRWGWSLRAVTIDLSTDPYMPADFDLDGYSEPLHNANGNVYKMDLGEFYMTGQYINAYALEWDSTVNRYKVIGGTGLGALTVIYQVVPPTLGEADVPFPSAMTIGIGAAIYAKQGENPTRADVTQEWDEFHAELKRHVAHSENNKPRRTNVNLQDYNGTYTGNTGH